MNDENDQPMVALGLLFPIVMGLNRRFQNDLDPFRIISRLAEECGELA